MNPYIINFTLKNMMLRSMVDFTLLSVQINAAISTYNAICLKPGIRNPKQIVGINIYPDRLEISLQSTNSLKTERLGNSLRLFSQLLVSNHNFSAYLTPTNPGKLFISI